MSNSIKEIYNEHPLYPSRMKDLAGMPELLYVLGSLPSDDMPTVGIVGARLCSPYGHRTAYHLARELASRGVQIISGMAAGIDGYAAEGALDAGAPSYAVLGNGVDICYPPGNRVLYERMITNGGIISEYPAGEEPLPFHFPARNRIISALSDLIIVVEARKKSGSLITADFALSQGKTVFAVPGRIDDRLSEGTNYLIAQGAGIAYSHEAILQELEGRALILNNESTRKLRAREARLRADIKKKASALSAEALMILELLQAEEPTTAEVLSEKLRLPISSILSSLNELVRCDFAEEPVRSRFILKR